jgi:DNA (cytosine-5)-methyltransferase 1
VSSTFVDLFAGVGGFHAALADLGLECVFASEIDEKARRVYAKTWGIVPGGDIRLASRAVPAATVLAAGFPCQPFSKSGFQRGAAEARGTLFWTICEALEASKPQVVVLENVRNLAGPRHRDTWDAIVGALRGLGYMVSSEPIVYSPHWLPPALGGTPQVRERVFIVGVYVGADRALSLDPSVPLPRGPISGWEPSDWNLDVDLRDHAAVHSDLVPSSDELHWIEVWNDFLCRVPSDYPMPGFPIWADDLRARPLHDSAHPAWKTTFLEKNAALYRDLHSEIVAWKRAHDGLRGLPASRRKLEWQAQASKRDMWSCVMHMRPSGIRLKRPTYLPALVAMAQIPVIGPWGRRISPLEAARLQGLEQVDFSGQSAAMTYRQLGNAVAPGVVRHVLLSVLHSWSDYAPSECDQLIDQAREHDEAVSAYVLGATAGIQQCLAA